MLTIALLGGAVWTSMAPLTLFLGIYLRHLGLTYSTIGFISTVGILLSSIPQLIFGAIADKIGKRKHIILFAMLIRTIASFMMLISNDAISISAWYVVTNFPLAGFMPIAQSMVADMSEKEEVGRSMGRYRLFGSAGWAISCILTGLLAEENIRNIFPIVFYSSLLALLLSIILQEPGKSRREEKGLAEHAKTSTSLVLTLFFMTSIIISSLSMGATNSFLTIFLSQLGMEPLLMGIMIAFGALMEIPAMYFTGLMCDRVGSLAVLSVSEVGLATVYWLYGTVSNIYTYIIVQGIRGILYAIFTVAGMTASSSLFEERRGGFYASLYNLSLNMGMAAGPYFGGIISDSLGILMNFFTSSIISFVSAAILSPWTLFRKRGSKHPR